MKKYVLYETKEYKEWLAGQTHKSRRQVLSRTLRIEEEGYFGHHKDLGEDVWELKFNDGRRIYYAIDASSVVLLLGGNKNGQNKDIKKATAIIRKIVKG